MSGAAPMEAGARRARLFEHLFHRLRLSEPWRFKAPFLISIPYFLLFTGGAPFAQSVTAIVCALLTIWGIAGLGYLSNDMFDREADREAGRRNGAAELSPGRLALTFALLLAAGLGPWVLYFPVDAVSASLLAAEAALLLAYSAPPVRLKDKGWMGAAADALYAHVTPALLAAYTFHALTGRVYGDFGAFAAALAGWQFFQGLRNILTHQLSDADNDRASGSATFVTRHGERATDRWLETAVVPLELLGFALFTATAARSMPILAAGWPLYAVVTAGIFRFNYKQPLRGPLTDRLDRFLNEYYLRWMPLVVLAGMCWRDGRMGWLLALHLALFRNGLTPWLERAWEGLAWGRGRGSWAAPKG